MVGWVSYETIHLSAEIGEINHCISQIPLSVMAVHATVMAVHAPLFIFARVIYILGRHTPYFAGVPHKVFSEVFRKTLVKLSRENELIHAIRLKAHCLYRKDHPANLHLCRA